MSTYHEVFLHYSGAALTGLLSSQGATIAVKELDQRINMNIRLAVAYGHILAQLAMKGQSEEAPSGPPSQMIQHAYDMANADVQQLQNERASRAAAQAAQQGQNAGWGSPMGPQQQQRPQQQYQGPPQGYQQPQQQYQQPQQGFQQPQGYPQPYPAQNQGDAGFAPGPLPWAAPPSNSNGGGAPPQTQQG